MSKPDQPSLFPEHEARIIDIADNPHTARLELADEARDDDAIASGDEQIRASELERLKAAEAGRHPSLQGRAALSETVQLDLKPAIPQSVIDMRAKLAAKQTPPTPAEERETRLIEMRRAHIANGDYGTI